MPTILRTAVMLLATAAASVTIGSSSAKALPTDASTVYRLYNTNLQHLFTIDHNEDLVLLGNPIWRNETPSFAAFPVSSAESCPAGTIPVYRIVNESTGQHLLTADVNEVSVLTTKPRTFYGEGIDLNHDAVFCAYAAEVAGTVPVFRLFNSVSGEHLWTTDHHEIDVINGRGDWHIETGNNGIAFYAYPV